jgi:hypothetical protein
VTKEKNPKVRRLRDIANFIEMMVMWSLNVLKIWKTYKKQLRRKT